MARLFTPDGGGGLDVGLGDLERRQLAVFIEEFRTRLLSADDPALRRLFPVAYHDDAARDAEYQRLAHGQLHESRFAALDVIEATLDAEHLDADEAAAWLQGINALRLVLGTVLDVSEDTDPLEDHLVDGDLDLDDPVARAALAYHWLGELLERLVRALGSDLPEQGRD